jgi:hypothetical protein
LWKATKRLKRQTTHIPAVRKNNRTWARKSKEKAEDFAEHLERNFQPNEEKNMANLRRIGEIQIQQLPPTIPEEILTAIQENINPKKAS